jgi:hypothetical protein
MLPHDFIMTGYLKHNDSRERVQSLRSQKADRMRRWRETRHETHHETRHETHNGTHHETPPSPHLTSVRTKNPPTPLAGGSRKPTKRELEKASAYRMNVHAMRCPHQPACATVTDCVQLVALTLRGH